MPRILAIIFALIFSFPALAQNNGNGLAGYIYPNATNGNFYCLNVAGQVCTAVSTYFVVPTITNSGSGTTEHNLQWIGIESTIATSGAGTGCPGFSCLMQFGIEEDVTSGGAVSIAAWHEVFCQSLAGQCSAGKVVLTNGSGGGQFPVAAGDFILATLTCTAACTTDAAGQQWTMQLVNVTQGSFTYTLTSIPASTGLAHVLWVEEVNGGTPHISTFSAIPFSKMMIGLNTANPVMQPVVLAADVGAIYNNTTSPSRSLCPSAPVGGSNGNAFLLCNTTGASSTRNCAALCPAGGSTGTNVGIGP